MTEAVTSDPLDYLSRPVDRLRACEACGSYSLTSGRLSTTGTLHGTGVDHIVMFACDECGDFWFERAGERLNAIAMRDLGLLSG